VEELQHKLDDEEFETLAVVGYIGTYGLGQIMLSMGGFYFLVIHLILYGMFVDSLVDFKKANARTQANDEGGNSPIQKWTTYGYNESLESYIGCNNGLGCMTMRVTE
jgi:hypothetical protein